MKYSFKTKVEALTTYIRIVSLIMRDTISPTDAYYLALFLCLPEKYRSYPFSTQARKYVRRFLQVTEGALNNRIYALIDNKYLYRDEDNMIDVVPFFKKLASQEQLVLNVTLLYEEAFGPDGYGSANYQHAKGPSDSSDGGPL